MQGYGPQTFGERMAEVYDDWYGTRIADRSTQAAADLLARLAAGGRVLELAIGTGRLALPLAQRGLSVHGIDASEAMVARLRQKPGGDAIPVTIGDFAAVDVPGRFDLVLVAFNSLFNLTSQAEQVRCFQNVAGRLTARGVFVVEAFVPDMAGAARGKLMPADKFGTGEMKLPEAIFAQTISGDYVVNKNNVEDRDMLLIPDPKTLRPVPWAKDPAASVFFDCYKRDGTPVPTSPTARPAGRGGGGGRAAPLHLRPPSMRCTHG